MVVSLNRGTLVILIIMTPKNVFLILGNPLLSLNPNPKPDEGPAERDDESAGMFGHLLRGAGASFCRFG